MNSKLLERTVKQNSQSKYNIGLEIFYKSFPLAIFSNRAKFWFFIYEFSRDVNLKKKNFQKTPVKSVLSLN